KIGWRVMQSFDDTPHEGGDLHRPGLHTLLAYLDEHAGQIQAVLVRDVRRLARNAIAGRRFVDELFKRHVVVRSVKEGGIGESAQGYAYLAERLDDGESDNHQRADDIHRGMLGAAAVGKWPHAAPWGYKASGKRDAIPVIDPRASAAWLEGFERVRERG